MDLVIAGIVVFAFLLASYSTRREWLALGSTSLSIALVAGCVFFSTAQDPNKIHDGLAQLAKRLPAAWDQPALKLTAAIERASTSLARARKEAAARPPILAGSITDWFSWGSGSQTQAEAEPEPVADDTPEAPVSSETPIAWLLDEPPPASGTAFLLSGANVSDQPIKAVQAVLKPDSGGGALALALNVEGRDGGAVIPPGARFHLTAARLTASEAERLGGAILSVAYVQAGRRKTSIMYLTPSMLAQRTARD